MAFAHSPFSLLTFEFFFAKPYQRHTLSTKEDDLLYKNMLWIFRLVWFVFYSQVIEVECPEDIYYCYDRSPRRLRWTSLLLWLRVAHGHRRVHISYLIPRGPHVLPLPDHIAYNVLVDLQLPAGPLPEPLTTRLVVFPTPRGQIQSQGRNPGIDTTHMHTHKQHLDNKGLTRFL